MNKPSYFYSVLVNPGIALAGLIYLLDFNGLIGLPQLGSSNYLYLNPATLIGCSIFAACVYAGELKKDVNYRTRLLAARKWRSVAIYALCFSHIGNKKVKDFLRGLILIPLVVATSAFLLILLPLLIFCLPLAILLFLISFIFDVSFTGQAWGYVFYAPSLVPFVISIKAAKQLATEVFTDEIA